MAVTLEEIRIRQLNGQHLLQPAAYETVVRDLCGVQAQFLSNAMHALLIRSHDFTEAAAQTLLKSWSLRGTMHVFSQEDLPLFLHEDRGRALRLCDTLEADERVTRERKRFFADLIVENVAAGINTRDALKAVCMAHGMTQQESESIFNSWGGTIRALCENGTLCHVVQEKKAFAICPPFVPMTKDEAQLELARRYFTSYGPATVKDAAYFFGATQKEVKAWLTQLPVVSARCCGRTYYWIESGRAPETDIPDCILLAGFDQLLLGHEKSESLFLPQEHLRGIFNLAGIVMPSVLLHGRVVGKWKKSGRKCAVTLFEPVCEADKKKIEACALQLWPDLRKVEYL